MNFADITDIAIPAGDVIKIQDSGGVVLWEKPFTGSTFTMYFKKAEDILENGFYIQNDGLVKIVINGGYFLGDDRATNIGNSRILGSGWRWIYYQNTSDQTVVTVYNPQNITTLRWGWTYSHLYSFSNMSSLTNLKTLEINSAKSFTQTLSISNLPSLQSLRIDRNSFTAAEGAVAMQNISITNLQNLTNLQCTAGSTLSLSGCPNLVDALISAQTISGGLNTLSGLSNLKTLNLLNITGTYNLSALSRLTKLESLYMTSCMYITGDLSALSNLVNMKYLTLGDCINTTGNLSSLSKMSNLLTLNLSSGVIQPNSSGGYDRVYSKFTGDASVMNTYAPNLRTFDYKYSAITGTWTKL
ncbi:MAG: hypothetical protein IJ667_07130 [Synergistaceae bacterium]|nr:hypothetical protein [Synergistaceae bacterium]